VSAQVPTASLFPVVHEAAPPGPFLAVPADTPVVWHSSAINAAKTVKTILRLTKLHSAHPCSELLT
jgi:hypothetical protein